MEYEDDLTPEEHASVPFNDEAYGLLKPLPSLRCGQNIATFRLKHHLRTMPIHSTQVVRLDGLMLAASVESSPVRISLRLVASKTNRVIKGGGKYRQPEDTAEVDCAWHDQQRFSSRCYRLGQLLVAVRRRSWSSQRKSFDMRVATSATMILYSSPSPREPFPSIWHRSTLTTYPQSSSTRTRTIALRIFVHTHSTTSIPSFSGRRSHTKILAPLTISRSSISNSKRRLKSCRRTSRTFSTAETV